MAKIFKVLAYVVIGIAGVVGLAIGFVYWKSGKMLERKYTVTIAPTVIPTDAAAIARGKHIADTRGCVDCHGADLAGAKVIDDPAMGRMYGRNLTRGHGGLVEGYSNADFVRAIRHGVGRDGRGLFLMPSAEYSHFTDADLGDLISYLNTVAPVDRASVPLALGPVARALFVTGKIKVAAAEIDHVALKPEAVVPAVTVEYGRYLAAGCTGCHGSNLSGGKIDIGPPDWPLAANLTPHSSGRLNGWTEDQFLATLRTGKRPDGGALNPVMPAAFGRMNDTELKAIWTYLKTVPPVAAGVR